MAWVDKCLYSFFCEDKKQKSAEKIISISEILEMESEIFQ